MSMEFINFARACGLNLEMSSLYVGERIRRCPTIEHPRSKSGAYFWDGRRGWAFAWDGEAVVQWFNGANSQPWTDAEKQAWKDKRQAAQTTQQKQYERAAMQAQALIDTAKPAEHNYLHLKGFGDMQGLVAPDGALLIPMRNVITNKLQGVQRIWWDEAERKYIKKMQYGMCAKNAVFRIGSRNATETCFCEGYATGLSLEVAARQMRLNAAVLVCFSAGNMAQVASQIRGKKYAYADNDASGAGEKAAQDAGIPYCMSVVVGNDANDDHKRLGLMAVCKKLMEVRRK